MAIQNEINSGRQQQHWDRKAGRQMLNGCTDNTLIFWRGLGLQFLFLFSLEIFDFFC